jgi:hypothetical protein
MVRARRTSTSSVPCSNSIRASGTGSPVTRYYKMELFPARRQRFTIF